MGIKERSELLKKGVKPNKKVFPLDLTTIPFFLEKTIKKQSHLLKSSPELQEIFPSKSVFPAYRRNKNLKELLAPSRFFNRNEDQNQPVAEGCFKCDEKRCDLSQHYLIQYTKFQSFATNRIYWIHQQLYCSSKNVMYLASCTLCRKQYVGSTSTEIKERFRNHKSSIEINNNENL